MSEGSGRSANAPGPAIHGATLRSTSFVGRTRELEELDRLIQANQLVTLRGPGGVGKTRLALESASRVSKAFPHGSWFVDLSGLTDEELVPGTIAGCLNLKLRPGRDSMDELRNALETRHALIVADNCEHMLDRCRDVIGRLVEWCPDLAVVSTSREALGLDAEIVFPVPPLDLPPAEAASAAEVGEYGAVRLFEDRAQKALPDYVISRNDAPIVAQLCRRLDGLPLAIELCAARVKVLSASQIDERLADRFRLLYSREEGVEARHRTMRAAIEWSYDLLEEPHRLLLKRLSVFAGGFDLDAVEVVCAGGRIEKEEILDTLTDLVDRSLVVRSEQAGRARCSLLESIRDFAAERREGEEDNDALSARHFDHFLAMAERSDVELRSPEQFDCLARLDAEMDNFRAALTWGLAHEDAARVLDLTWLLHGYWFTRGHFIESATWFNRVMAKVGNVSPSVNLTRAFIRWGELAEMTGDYDTVRARYEKSLEIARIVGDPVRIGVGLLALGEVDLAIGDLDAARVQIEESLTYFIGAGDRERERWSQHGLAKIAIAVQDLESARRRTVENLSRARELGNESGIADEAILLGVITRMYGDLVAGLALLEEGLGLARRVGDRIVEIQALLGLSRVYVDLGSPAQGLAVALEALRLSEDGGVRPHVVEAIEGVGSVTAALAQFDVSIRLLAAAAAWRERLPLPLLGPDAGRREEELKWAEDAVGAQMFASVWGQGRAMSLEGASALALQQHAPKGQELGGSPSISLDGDVWTLLYDGQGVRLRDSRGIRFLATLLTNPGREFHVLDIASSGRESTRVPTGSGAVLDDAAKTAYGERIKELRSALEVAEEMGHSDAASTARAEMEFIERELASAYGLGGKARKLDDPAERARKAVSNRIRDTLSRIDRHHPQLGRHLRASVRTGVFCSYDPETATVWTRVGPR